MAHNYALCDRDQLMMLPPNLREWLPEDHLAWFVLDVVDKVDATALHERHPNTGAGRAAYNPEMLLALLVYAYCLGVRSSRQIERSCRVDVAYRVICANQVPDHTTIARFRQDHEQAMQGLFVDVLMLCHKAGLAELGTVAIDGTKMGADASLDANRTRERIEAEVSKILSEAVRTDADQDQLFGEARGDELPAHLANRGSRLERLQECLRQIDEEKAADRAKADARRAKADAAAAEGRKLAGRRPNNVDPVAEAEYNLAVAEAKRRASVEQRAKAQSKAEAAGRALKGPKPDPDAPVQKAEAALDRARAQAATNPADPAPAATKQQANPTDPDSRIMKTANGWLQGYNAQAAVNANQIVLAADVTNEHNDSRQLVPMMAAARAALDSAGITELIEMVLADAGYWSEQNALVPGPTRLIATLKDWKQRRAARELGQTTGDPAPDVGVLEAMEHLLRTQEGTDAYAKRSCTVEPVFGQTKEGRGFRRFMRRGLEAVDGEWKLIAATHNILKLFAHRTATTVIA